VSLGLVGLLIAAAAVQTRQAAPAAEPDDRAGLADRAATRDSDEMQSGSTRSRPRSPPPRRQR
jgi:hypothetical protein